MASHGGTNARRYAGEAAHFIDIQCRAKLSGRLCFAGMAVRRTKLSRRVCQGGAIARQFGVEKVLAPVDGAPKLQACDELQAGEV